MKIVFYTLNLNGLLMTISLIVRGYSPEHSEQEMKLNIPQRYQHALSVQRDVSVEVFVIAAWPNLTNILVHCLLICR